MKHFNLLKPLSLLLVPLGLVMVGTPALAHHGMDGAMATTFLQGLLSGLAHPLIGFDHFAFIVAVGLLSALQQRGLLLPISFSVAAMVGTALHLAGLPLPGVEWLVSGSVLFIGLILALPHHLNATTLAGLAAIAGLCHGYAYGEAIFGAEMAPLLAYLIGFTGIQLVVIFAAFGVGHWLQGADQRRVSFRSAGWMVTGIGLTFLVSQLLNAAFPGV